jgi:molybdopterin molybdotransferase
MIRTQVSIVDGPVLPGTLPQGAALRIVTGAPVPPGAEIVVKREDVEEGGGRVRFSPAAMAMKPGINIRRQGENARAGTPVLAAGMEITPPVAAALASFGCAEPTVRRRVRVGVLVTGDEVLGVGDRPSPYQLRDSNGYTVMNMVSRRAWAEAYRSPTVKDDPGVLLAAMKDLLARADMVITTGGVSMGERDFVPQVIRELGAAVLFHKVNQRPGKPVLGAVLEDGRPIFGLPGNPQSVMVTCRRMVMPVLDRLAGLERSSMGALVRLEQHDGRKLDMWWHRFVRLTQPGMAVLVDISSSGDVIGASRSDGFVELPPGGAGEGPWPYYAWSES